MRLQSELDIVGPENDDRGELEDLCVSAKSLFLGILSKSRRSSMPETFFCAQSHQSRLPNMKLLKFSGKYSEYKNFISLFENLVHTDPILADIEKFSLTSLKKVYENDCLIFF